MSTIGIAVIGCGWVCEKVHLPALARLSDAFDRVMERTPNPHVTLNATMPADELAQAAFSALQHYNAHLAAS